MLWYRVFLFVLPSFLSRAAGRSAAHRVSPLSHLEVDLDAALVRLSRRKPNLTEFSISFLPSFVRAGLDECTVGSG